jgi:hypothetical protein
VYGDIDQLPAAARSGDVSLFDQYLADSGQDYIIAGQLHEQQAHVRFTGTFHGQAVVWDCEFVTLAGDAARAAGAAGTPDVRNYIEVAEAGPRGVPIRVGLAIARIDRPAIEKMIIMIRNYKNLHYGRHEYGEPHVPVNPAP